MTPESCWELCDARFAYGRRPIVDGVSLAVRPGRVVGALGPNGAGKSTLLRLALGLLEPQSGAALLNGRPLRKIPRHEVARAVAFMPQVNEIAFEFTAGQLVMLGRHPWLGRFEWPGERDRDIARRAMALTDTLEFEDRVAATLSGGERQRVFLSRALAAETRFLALDEPTANLDIEHAISLMRLIRTLAREEGRGALIAMHDLNLAYRYCDEVILLRNGRVIAQGAPEEALTPDAIREVFRVEAEVLRGAGGSPTLAFQERS